jgi:hypothetical protein
VLTLEYPAELTMAILSHLPTKDARAGFVTDFSALIERLAPILVEGKRDTNCVRREPCKVLIFKGVGVALQMFHPPTRIRSEL